MSAVVHSISKSSRSLVQKPARRARLLRRMNASIFWQSCEVAKPTPALDAWISLATKTAKQHSNCSNKSITSTSTIIFSITCITDKSASYGCIWLQHTLGPLFGIYPRLGYSRLGQSPKVNFWEVLWQNFHEPDDLPVAQPTNRNIQS